jgi:hypothetical protein
VNLSPELAETCIVDEATIQAILDNLDPLIATPHELTDDQVTELIVFLQALTSPSAIDLSGNIPASVPSGLPVDD